MMNAEVTTENKPACTPSQEEFIKSRYITHEDQGRAKILVSPEEFLVVPLGHLAIVLIKPSPVIVLSRHCVPFRAAGELSGILMGAKKSTCLPFFERFVHWRGVDHTLIRRFGQNSGTRQSFDVSLT